MASSSEDDLKYDVFLSSGGEDIRRTFTDHLYCSLKDHRINVFKYDDKLEKRDGSIPEHLIQAIEKSKVSVVVFSRGYLESAWCRDELVKIMECRETLGQLFFPIFYDVDPIAALDPRSFEEAFQKYEPKIKEKMLRTWRVARSEAAFSTRLNFMKSDGHEGNFIRNVIAWITEKLGRTTCLEVPTSLVGMDSRVREISKHLDVGGSKDVYIIGILGMCGLGKTTVAKAIFNEHCHNFDGASFLQIVREKKLVDLQEQLLFDILKQSYIGVSCIDEGTEEIERRLGNRKVLVVIDDLDSVEQIDALAIKPGSFGPGSRIIITSRNKHLLKVLNVDKICSLPAMSEREALELLSWHAFGKNYPNEEYVELSRKAVGYCGGLALALEVLGSYLRAKSTSEWETVLDKWNRSQPYREIHRRLEISYDGLTDDDVKAIFLDISCFFIGMNKDYIMTVLDGCQFYPEIGIRELQEQCLVTVDIEGNLMMHDLIQGMGREIVCAESPDNPGERSRLWHNEDITDVLTKRSGTEDVEGLALDMQESDECSFSTEAFRKMQSLRLLKLNNIKLTGNYHNLSKELRWLCWHGFPLEVIPENFDQPNLVAVDLSYSKLIRVWENTDVLLKNLKIINLSHSHYLTESPDLSKVPNLEKLILVNCVRLSKIHPSIGHLERLSLVNLEDCKTLQYFPGDFCKSKSVETLILKGCTGFMILRDKGKMVSSTTLQASHTIRKLPSSIAGLKNLRSVLPSLQGLNSLTLLSLGNCGLTDDAIPEDLGSLFSLEILELAGNLFYSLPSLSRLSKLKMLDLSCCIDLHEIPDLPTNLEILRANQCIALEKMPNFSEMSSMVELHLNRSPKLTEILGLHKSLNTMRRIHMEGCTNLTADFRKNIIQGWTSCGHGDIFLDGIYDIPEWFQFVDIREPNDVHFKVPQIIGRNFRGLTVCCIFETYCPGFTVTNITKGKALHIWEESTCWVAASVLRLQSVLSNDVLHLQSGDEVSISAVTEAHGTGRVMKTGVNLVWDDGDGGDAYTSNDEMGAVPSNTSSDETLPSPSVHTGGYPPMAWAPFARSIFSLRRDQLNSMETHGLSGGGGGGSGGLNLDSFKIHVADCFLQLSSSPHDLLSLPWLRDLLDSFLRIHQEFKTLLILSSTKTHISKPTVDRYISDYFERSVKALDVCNAIRDGIEEIRQWLKLLDIVLVALGRDRTLGEGQFRRAKKALVDLAIAMLDDKDSSNTTMAHRNRSFGRNNTKDHHHQQHRSLGHFRSLSWSVSRSWSAARQLQAIGNNLYAPRPNEIVASSGLAPAVFTINSVLLFVMWALVAAIPCQDRGLQVHFNVPRSFVWAGSMLSLHDRIMDESKRRDRRNACALLKEIHQIERCSRVIGDLADSAHFPLAEAKEKEVRERVQELSSLCEGIKEGLDPLERQVREVFHGIVKSRTEGMDSYGRANNPE